MNGLYLVSKAGRLRSGSDGRGSIWHLSERDPESGMGFDYPALCNASPHIMWSTTHRPDQKATCKKCIRLAKARGEVVA